MGLRRRTSRKGVLVTLVMEGMIYERMCTFCFAGAPGAPGVSGMVLFSFSVSTRLDTSDCVLCILHRTGGEAGLV